VLESERTVAELYDLRTRHLAADLPLILEIASRATSVLELGCGTGRVLRALEQAGISSLAGVDSSDGAVELARRLVPRADVVRQRMQDLDLQRQFDLILIPFNTMELLPSMDDLLEALRRVGEHCRLGGELFIDTRPWTFEGESSAQPAPLRKLRQLSDPARGEVDVFFSSRRDTADRRSRCTMLYRWATPQGDVIVNDEYVVRPLTVDEVRLALASRGFSITWLRGDYRRADYDPRLHVQMNVLASRA